MQRIVTILICLYFLSNCVVWIIVETLSDEVDEAQIYKDFLEKYPDCENPWKSYILYRFGLDLTYILIGTPVAIVALVNTIRQKFRH